MRTVVITGAGGILGRAMITEFAAHDYSIAVLDRDFEAATAAAQLAPEAAYAFQCDVSDPDEIRQTASEIEAKLGFASGLVCNAATKSDHFFDEYCSFPVGDWNQVIATNLTGPMLCAQVFGEKMASASYGAIVNILSIYGIVAPDQRIYAGSEYEGRPINTPAVYSATKAGLWGLTKYLASYWGRQGVRVNAVTPGGVFSGQNETFVSNYAERTMLGRMAKPGEIATAVQYLVSDRSSYVTGQNLVVDGGWTSW